VTIKYVVGGGGTGGTAYNDALARLAVGARVVVHGSVASIARPATEVPVIWFGEVEPTNWIDGDVWEAVGNSAGGVGDVGGSTSVTQRVVTANYTLVTADASSVLHVTASSGIVITLPQDSAASLDIETAIPWRQVGAGQIVFAAGAGAVLRSRGSAFKSAGQYAEGLITKIAANTWLLSGDVVV
jgi:hypothetical protein